MLEKLACKLIFEEVFFNYLEELLKQHCYAGSNNKFRKKKSTRTLFGEAAVFFKVFL